MDALKPYMEPGESSVGTLVNIRHISPTPLGLTRYSHRHFDRNRRAATYFHVEARDELDKVGEGHPREVPHFGRPFYFLGPVRNPQGEIHLA